MAARRPIRAVQPSLRMLEAQETNLEMTATKDRPPKKPKLTKATGDKTNVSWTLAHPLGSRPCPSGLSLGMRLVHPLVVLPQSSHNPHPDGDHRLDQVQYALAAPRFPYIAFRLYPTALLPAATTALGLAATTASRGAVGFVFCFEGSACRKNDGWADPIIRHCSKRWSMMSK